MRIKRPDAGFTLIEVVVAFVVAALVLVAAMRLFGGAFDGSARAARMSIALVGAESTMESVGTAIPFKLGTQPGHVLQANHRYRRQVSLFVIMANLSL